MNKLPLICLSLVACVAGALAEGVDALAPSAINPKAVPKQESLRPDQRPRSPRSPDGDAPLIPDLKLKGVVLVKERSQVQEAGVPTGSGLVVRDIPFLDSPGFRSMVEKQFIGRLLTKNLVQDLEDSIILYCRERGKVLVDVILVPEQNLENGVIQLWFLEGKVGRLTVKNEGHKWFSDKFILRNVNLQPGGPVDSFELNHDLNWLNNNPFRQVDVVFRQGTNIGLTDVQLQVEDRLPLRGYIGYEDSGTVATGEDRLLAGFNWGNAFGLDHQFNYQYATDVGFDLVRAHSASYIAPLPWRHVLTLFGAYVDAKARFPDGTSSEGSSWQASGRYTIPLPDLQKYRHELSGGFDFKRGNNNFLFGGSSVSAIPSDTDVAQFELGYSGLRPDHYGRTSFGLELYYSPGGLTEFNDNAHLDGLRTGAKAEYFYGRITAERVTRLPGDFSWILRGWGQIATERLMPSEEIALGGYSTIRGYDERVVLGDNGWIIINEVRTPPFLLGNLLNQPGGSDDLQFLAFFDAGGVTVNNQSTSDLQNPNKTLCSAGLGLRYTVSRNFSLRFDYGIPLTETKLNQHNSRGHIGLMLSF
jgi:hemolysin activation/secretion protein